MPAVSVTVIPPDNMFDTLRTTSTTIADINLGSYLLLRGAKLEGVTTYQPNRSMFTFTHKNLTDFIHEYNQCMEIRFAPRLIFQYREDLKRMNSNGTVAVASHR